MDVVKGIFLSLLMIGTLYFVFLFMSFKPKFTITIPEPMDIVLSIWSSCINNDVFVLYDSDISFLSQYKCRIIDCIGDFPVYITLNYSGTIMNFGICSLDNSSCYKRKYMVVINNNNLADFYVNVCLDDLSIFTVMLQKHCRENKSFSFIFSKKRFIELSPHRVCIDGVCNSISCVNIQTFSGDVKEIFLYYNKTTNIYNVYELK